MSGRLTFPGSVVVPEPRFFNYYYAFRQTPHTWRYRVEEKVSEPDTFGSWSERGTEFMAEVSDDWELAG